MCSKHLFTLRDLASLSVITIPFKVIVFKGKGDVIESLCLSQPDTESSLLSSTQMTVVFSALSLI